MGLFTVATSQGMKRENPREGFTQGRHLVGCNLHLKGVQGQRAAGHPAAQGHLPPGLGAPTAHLVPTLASQELHRGASQRRLSGCEAPGPQGPEAGLLRFRGWSVRSAKPRKIGASWRDLEHSPDPSWEAVQEEGSVPGQVSRSR